MKNINFMKCDLAQSNEIEHQKTQKTGMFGSAQRVAEVKFFSP